MPQMAPMWWMLILMISSILTIQIITNLEFDKEKNKKSMKKKIKKIKMFKFTW
uniref:ATP synthase F0 subunit 8 n=1 Tax=Symplanella brevicephala TaxID=871677 RepID=UPI001E777DA3|nr:ATP synthase F0 subunit 8 [Symplanella brevicephala]UDL71996.1 ATP synthase F0 subunit 8 [Symplanella brevicephala]